MKLVFLQIHTFFYNIRYFNTSNTRMGRKTNNPSTKLDAKVPLLKISLEDLSSSLEEILSSNFSSVNVSVVDCPDLTLAPFNLISRGLGGSPRIVDVGGPGKAFPNIDTTPYNLADICKTAELPKCMAIGPGAGSIRQLGYNTELVHNAYIAPNDQSKFGSYIISLKEPTSESPKPYAVGQLTDSTAEEFSLLSSLLLTEGKPGKVIKIEAKNRTGPENFVTQMRLGLAKKYGTQPVGLGGVILIRSGKVKLHIMPELPKERFKSKEDMYKWLAHFVMDAPLTCASVFISHDPGLDLRLEHTHCFSDHGDGGHYQHDVTPNTVHYEAYFTPAEYLYRIDRVSF